MKNFRALFHGTAVYINGTHLYQSNEILTAYLNLETDRLMGWHHALTDGMKNLMFRMDFDDEQRYELYNKNVTWVQKNIDQIDEIWPMMLPYEAIADSEDHSPNKLMRCLFDFLDLLDGGKVSMGLPECSDEDYDPDYQCQLISFVPESTDWYWENEDSQFAVETMSRINELNGAIRTVIQPYIYWVEDVLRVKLCYEVLLDKYLHIKHSFLSETELAKQFAEYFKTESIASTTYRRLSGPAPVASKHEVFTPENKEPLLCASFDFDRIGAFLYEDFFRGLANNYIPKRCSNCGKWFLLTAGIYSDYCENPLAGDKNKTCRMVSARKKYDTKCREDPIWNVYNKAYKAHYARSMKKKMTRAEFEAWSRWAVELREKAERGEIPLEVYSAEIRK